MLSGRKVGLRKVCSLHTEDSHFSTFEFFAAVPIYNSFCFESVMKCSSCAPLLCFVRFLFIPNCLV